MSENEVQQLILQHRYGQAGDQRVDDGLNEALHGGSHAAALREAVEREYGQRRQRHCDAGGVNHHGADHTDNAGCEQGRQQQVERAGDEHDGKSQQDGFLHRPAMRKLG